MVNRRIVDVSTCKLPDCEKLVKRMGYCYSHYMKQWRYGTPDPQFEPTWVDITGQRFGTLTIEERRGDKWFCRCDCGRTRLALAGDLNRTGQESTCGHRTTHRRADVVTYSGAHERCDADRGLSKNHRCIDCGGQAKHWSYNHDDPAELIAKLGRSDVPYSLDPWHYSPRCVSCHKLFDLGRTKSTFTDTAELALFD